MNFTNIIIFSSTPSTNHSIRMLYNTPADQNYELWACDQPIIPDLRIKNNWTNSSIGLLRLLYKIWALKLNSSYKINIHHEFNVYNGIVGVIFFPLFLIVNRNIIVTLHAYIPQKVITKNFLLRFNIKLPRFIAAVFFKFFYYFVFRFSKKIILHSNEQYQDAVFDFNKFRHKYSVLVPGVDFAEPNPSIRKIFQLSKPYDFLSFGYISPRKGFDNILLALKILADSNIYPNYLICGFIQDKNISYYNRIKEFISLNKLNVDIIPGVDDHFIDSIFAQCRYSIFLYEDLLGHSGPLNFALANNSKLICRSKGTFLEMAKDSSIFVDDLYPDTIANSFRQALNDNSISPKNSHPNWLQYVKRTFEDL